MSTGTKVEALDDGYDQAQEAAGLAVQELLRSHFQRLNKERHRGLYMPGFYAKAANAVSYKVTTQGGSSAIDISISGPVGIAQRYYGGTIVPKNAKLLAIPNWKMVPETASHGPREFNNLRFVKFGKGKDAPMALVESGRASLGKKKVRKGGAAEMKKGRVFFWLVKKVVQMPDPSVIPAMDDIAKVAYRAMEQAYDLLSKKP